MSLYLCKCETQSPSLGFCWLLCWCSHSFFSMVLDLKKRMIICKSLVLLDCPFADPLPRESRIVLGVVGSVAIGISGLPSPLTLHLGCMGGPWRNPGNSSPGFLWVLRKPDGLLSSLRPSVFLCLFYIQCPRFLDVMSRKNRATFIYSTFPVYAFDILVLPYWFG